MLRRAFQACCQQLGRVSAAAEVMVASTSGLSRCLIEEELWQQGGHMLNTVRTKYTYKIKKVGLMPGLIYWKPRTPGLRHKISIDYNGLGVYTGTPFPALSLPVHKSGGRNETGRITVRHRGGGDEKLLRMVDFKRGHELYGVTGVVQRVELDPNRSGFLALVKYSPEGQLPVFRYHLAPADVKEGDVFLSGDSAPVRPGSVMTLRNVPMGVSIHNVELKPGKGGEIARAASASCVIQAKQDGYAIVKMPSGETRKIPLDCHATIGMVSNQLQKMINHGKAGERRRLGWRPTVRGIAMNPIDHPHGGRGNGGRPSCSPWGVYTKGKVTRNRNKFSNRYILVRKGGKPTEKFVQAKKWRAKAKLEKLIASGSKASQRAKPVPPEP